jgi:hypothetical protein
VVINRKYGSRFAALVVMALGVVSSTRGMSGEKTPLSSIKRDPFWPVGYQPKTMSTQDMSDVKQEPVPVGGQGEWDAAMKQIVINGVSSSADGDFFAVINGEIKSVGATVVATHGGRKYTWMVDSIKPPESVKLRRISVK